MRSHPSDNETTRILSTPKSRTTANLALAESQTLYF